MFILGPMLLELSFLSAATTEQQNVVHLFEPHGTTSFNYGETWQTSTAAFFQGCVSWVWHGIRVKFTNTKGEVYVTGKAECC